MSAPKICVVGAANIDLISYVPRLPRMGETLHGDRFRMGYGGKGANQAVMAAKLGAEVAMVTKLGEDMFGGRTLDNFRSFGIDTGHVHSTGEAFSGVAPIAVDPDGHNAIIIVTGANDLLTEDEIAAAGETIARADVLVCQLEIPLEISMAAMRIARRAGTTVIFNPAPARADLPEELYELTDIICPNEPETEQLAGAKVEGREDAENAARILLGRGAGAVVLTLGGRGSLLVTEGRCVYLPAERVDPVDTTGAGDAFVGSLAFFIAAETPLEKAAARANRVAAFSVRGRGTQTSFPSRDDLPWFR